LNQRPLGKRLTYTAEPYAGATLGAATTAADYILELRPLPLEARCIDVREIVANDPNGLAPGTQAGHADEERSYCHCTPDGPFEQDPSHLASERRAARQTDSARGVALHAVLRRVDRVRNT
jgi:hypothetical protein